MPDSDALIGGGMGYAPIASGIREPIRYGTEGVPVVDSFGPLGTAVLSGPFQSMMQSAGYAPMGIGHDQNIYDIMRARQFYAQQRQAVAQAAMFDRRHYMRTMQNLYSAAGINFGLEQRRTAGAIANLAMAGSPILTQMAPEFLDALGGQVGSAAVLSSRIMDAGRYMMDPVTGMSGMSAASASHLTGQLYAGVEARRGRDISAGGMGALFAELEHRGRIGSSGFLSQQDQLAALRNDAAFGQRGLDAAANRIGISARGSISGKDLDNLMMDPEVSERLRAIDSSRIQKNIEGYAKAVSVMRDIFGDSGRPNAPMKDLLAGLEALTMGMSNQFDPTQLGNIAQKTYTLSKNAGINMTALMAIQGNMAAGAARSGLDPSFAVGGTQQSLAANQALRQLGYGQGGGWNGMSVDQMTQLYGNLYTGAAASDVGNRLSFLNRAGQEVGFKEGSAGAAAFAALKSGQTTFRDPTTGREISLTSLGNDSMMSLVADSTGMSRAAALRMIGERNVNKEFTSSAVINTTMASQFSDVRRQLLGHTTASALQGALGERMSPEQAREMASKVSGTVMDQFMTLRADNISNFKGDMSATIEAAVRQHGGGAMLDNMSAEERQRYLNGLTTTVIGANNQAMKNSNFSGFGDLLGLRRMAGPELARRVGQLDSQADADAAMLNSLSGLGRGGLLRRGFDALSGLTDLSAPGAVKGALAKTVGGVSVGDISDAISGPMIEIEKMRREAASLSRQINSTNDPVAKAKLVEQYNKLTSSMKEKADALGTVAGQSGGIFGSGALTPGALSEATRTQQTLHAMTLDTLDLTSGVSGYVSDRDANEAAMRYGAMRQNMSDDDLTRMVAEQKRIAIEGKTYNPEELKAWQEKFGMYTASPGDIAEVARKYELNALSTLKLTPEQLFAARNDPNALGGLSGSNNQNAMTEFGRVVAKYERSRTPLAVTDAAIAEYRRTDEQGKTMTDSQARFQLEMLQRAERWGISRDKVVRGKNADGTDETHADAAKRMYLGMRDNLLFTNPEAKDQAAEKERSRKARLTAFVEGQENAKRFWRSNDAIRVRDAVEAGDEQMDAFINAVASDSSEVRGMGYDAVRTARRFKEIKKERQRLADIYTGGDLARLQIGDFTYNAADEKEARRAMEAKRAVEVMTAEIATGDIVIRQRKLGKSLSAEDEAINILGFDRNKMTLEQQQKARNLTDGINAFRRIQSLGQLGTAETARGIKEQINSAAKAANMTPEEYMQAKPTDTLVAKYTAMSKELGDHWHKAMEYDDMLQKGRESLGGTEAKNDFAELLGYHGISEARASSNPGLMARLKNQKHRLEMWKEGAKRLVTRADSAGLDGTDKIGRMQEEFDKAEKEGTIAKFRERFGIKDDNEYAAFREDLVVQKRLRGGKLQGTESQRFAAMAEGIEKQTAPQMNVVATLPDNMKLTLAGSVTLNRDGTTVTPDASTSGQLSQVAGGR